MKHVLSQKLRCNCVRKGVMVLVCDFNAKNIGACTWLYIYIFISKMYSLTSKCPAEITVMGMWFS